MFKKAPTVWILMDLLKHCKETLSHEEEGWVPARPLGLDTIQQRFKAAWLVFSGQADAVKWPFQ